MRTEPNEQLTSQRPVKWRLIEALKEFVASELWETFHEAERAWQAAGGPTRFMYRSDYVEGSAAKIHNDGEHQRSRLRDQVTLCSRALWEALRAKLLAGQLIAEGSPGNPNAAPTRIRSEAWKYAGFGRANDSIVVFEGSEPKLFFDVWVFVAPQRAALARAVSSSKARSGCKEWLIGEMNASPQARPKNKRAYLQEAKRLFPGLSERSFNAAWNAAVEKTGSCWNLPGRPSKSQHSISSRK